MIIWRRHVEPCKSGNRSDPRCKCPIYQEFRVGKKRFRRTLKTRNWQKALQIAREEELNGLPKPKSPTIEQAGERFLEDAKARGVREPTLYKFRLLFQQMKTFAEDKGLVFVSDFDLESARQFRETWPNTNFGARKKLQELRTFFHFCTASKWISENPASLLKPGKTVAPQIIPITAEELEKILEACQSHSNKRNAIRLRALLLLMRHTGLRIRDAVTLRRADIQDGRAIVRTAKTGADIRCPIPPVLQDALDAVPPGGEFYFWNGASKPKSAVGNYQRALRRLFKSAKTPRVFPHLFRHTFATELLSTGSGLEDVARLLGHSSIRVTERNYSHWIKSRQDRLEESVKNTWAQLGTMRAKPPSKQRQIQ